MNQEQIGKIALGIALALIVTAEALGVKMVENNGKGRR